MRSDLDIWNFAACVHWGLVYWKCNTCNSFQWYIVTSGTRDITPAHSSRALFADWGKTYKLCAFWRNPLRERGDLCNKEKLLGRKYSTYLLFLNTFSSGNVTYTDNKSPEPSESEVIDMCSTNNLLLMFYLFDYPLLWDLCSTFLEINHMRPREVLPRVMRPGCIRTQQFARDKNEN